MADDKIGVLEHLSRAMSSGNLKLKDGNCDLDYILALSGAARIVAGGSAVLHLNLSATRDAYAEARKVAISLATKLSYRKEWKLERKDVIRVAEVALKHYICPVCPECIGRRFDILPGTPMLDAKPCRRCHGSGIRPLPIRNGRMIAEVRAAIENIEIVAGHETWKRLGK